MMKSENCKYTSMLIRSFDTAEFEEGDRKHIESCQTCAMAFEIRKALIKGMPASVPSRVESLWYRHNVQKLIQHEHRHSAMQMNLSLALNVIIAGIVTILLITSIKSGFGLIRIPDNEIFNWLNKSPANSMVWLTAILAILAGLGLKRKFKIKN